MSDGISDGYREEREAREKAAYLMALATHLTVGTQDTLEKLTSARQDVHLKDSLEATLLSLKSNNKVEWAKFLLSCQEECISAFQRARHLAPWGSGYSLSKVVFDRWSEKGMFFRPFFHRAGYATNEGSGNLGGYDSYALIYHEDMTIRDIVKEAIWVGFKMTSWSTQEPSSPMPTSPLLKDRKAV